MSQEQQKPFGKLFNSIELNSEEHLEMILQTMNKENAKFIMIQALKFAYNTGVFSIGEVEVLSKCIRTISRVEEQSND